MTRALHRRRSPPPAGDLAARIGDRLRHVRAERGASQAAIGAPHYGRAAVSAVERGRSLPSLGMLRHLAGRLGTTMRELLPPDA